MSEDEMMLEEEEAEVDMSGFVATEEMNALSAVADEAVSPPWATRCRASLPMLSDAALETLQAPPFDIAHLSARRRPMTTQYDRFMRMRAAARRFNTTSACIIRYGDDLIYRAAWR